jgi:L-threonylcarbamoyladenylate synthase
MGRGSAADLMAEIGKDIQKAVNLLKKGEVIALPTETVYGLAALISDEQAIRRIFEVKNRPLADPLIVHVASIARLRALVKDLPTVGEKILEAFSPGPITLLLPKSGLVSDLITHSSPLVAIRIPAHPLCLELLQELDAPVAAPSANPFGGISPTRPAHVQAGLGDKIPYILDGGDCRIGLESTIVRPYPDGKIEVLRPGGIPAEELQLLADLHRTELPGSRPVVPGSMMSHYAPDKPLLLEPSHLPEGKIVFLRFQALLPDFPAADQRILSPTGNLSEAARNLFALLHELDALDASCIVAEKVPDSGLGRAVNDRLMRASAKRIIR